jgi:hypothetical protein
MQNAIAQLEITLSSYENNLPHHVVRGDFGQASGSAQTILDIRAAIAALRDHIAGAGAAAAATERTMNNAIPDHEMLRAAASKMLSEAVEDVRKASESVNATIGALRAGAAAEAAKPGPVLGEELARMAADHIAGGGAPFGHAKPVTASARADAVTFLTEQLACLKNRAIFDADLEISEKVSGAVIYGIGGPDGAAPTYPTFSDEAREALRQRYVAKYRQRFADALGRLWAPTTSTGD